MSYDSMISAIGSQSQIVNDKMESLAGIKDPKKLLEASMQLMKEQQRLTIMSEGFTKTMKANHDAAKSAITNMH